VKVFVYGTLRRGHKNAGHLEGSTLVSANALTAEHAFQMLCTGLFPAVVAGRHAILGEVYEVDDVTLQKIDFLEGNGRMYARRPVPIQRIGDCQMYIWILSQSDMCTQTGHVHLNPHLNVQSWIGI
jgi:gamma-glutamylaminecyclotransferase